MKKMNKLCVGLGLAGCIAYLSMFGIVAQAAENSARITGLYSDMWYLTSKQKIMGTEIFIMQNQAGYVAMVQCAQGLAGTPFIVPLTLKGNAVAIDIPAREDSLCCPGRFTGSVVEKQLRGQFEGCNSSPLVLVRKNSYWQ
ncbi:MAG: hypothetical protein HY273_05100 [Gammaproteobacteria bacterium]|nr:hypothetical protein [Gammaproteobacteria bacterium]